MAAIFDFSQIRTSVFLKYSSRVARPRKHGYSRWNFVAIMYTTEDISVMYVRPVHSHHLDFRHDFLSSVIFVIGGNSSVLKNIIPITVSLYHWSFTSVDIYDDAFSFRNLYKLLLPTSYVVEVATG